jgi:hypothetical protein
LTRGDRNRNQKIAALREAVRPDRAVLAVDLGEDKQVAVVVDHDGRVLGRRVVKSKAHQLAGLLGWAAERAAVQGNGPHREPVYAMRQPVLERVAHCVSPPRPQPNIDLFMQFPKLVANLDLGLAADLLTDARPNRAEAKVRRADVLLPGLVPVDRVLAVPATRARGVQHDPLLSRPKFGSQRHAFEHPHSL